MVVLSLDDAINDMYESYNVSSLPHVDVFVDEFLPQV